MNFEVVRKGNLFINRDFLPFLESLGLETYEDFLELEGDVVKSVVRERTTTRHLLGAGVFYMKKQVLPGFKETLKLLLRFRLPQDAMKEWRAILAFHARGIPTITPVAAGRKLLGGAIVKESFLLTDGLEDARRLDHFLKERFGMPCRGEALSDKRAILARLADLSRDMHRKGFNHRDFYLCHIFTDSRGRLFILDLHRVDIRKKVGRRWIVKDLAALLFSSMEAPVTSGQRMAFYKRYMGIERLSAKDKVFIREVTRKAVRMARHTCKMYMHESISGNSGH